MQTRANSRANAGAERAGPRFGTLPFAATLAASVGLLVLLAVAAVLAIQWRTSQQNTLSLLNREAVLIVDRLETGVRLHLQPASALAGFVAGQVEAGSLEPSDQAAMAEILTGALAAAPQISGAVFVDPSFHQSGVTRGSGALARFERDVSRLPGIGQAMDEARLAGEAFWAEPVFTEFGATVINLRQPLLREGRFLGLLVVGITVPELSEIVTQAGDLFGATAFVLYGRDRVLAHPFLASTASRGSHDEPLTPLNETGDLVLASLWEGETIRGFEQAAAAEVKVQQLGVGGQDYVVLVKWIEGYGNRPWALGAWFPAADVTVELRRLWLAGAAGVAILLLAVLAAILLGRFVARPIVRVAANAAKVGALDLEQVELLAPSAIRELNDQARAFNAMLAGLRSFETYVPRSLVTRLIREGDGGALRAEERELTVLFTDIVGFTPMCEGLPASEVAQFLNEHFALLGACIEAEGGTVDKFIGDALMAFWGAPDKQKDRAIRACRAALAIARAVEADNADRATRGQPPIRLRVGIHTGPVMVGNVGWPGRMNYTIVGDTVNSCQRLEALGKELPGGGEHEAAVTILISGETAERLGPDFTTEHVGNIEVRGRREPIEVYRLLA
ncbi:MAG: adenylate/guanylate cyclase domain-containing protein [Kiloniellales bacterium]